VRGILGQWNVRQDDKAADDDALGDRPIAEKLDIATGIIGAVARYIDGMAFGLERGSGNLGGSEVDGGTDRGALEIRSPRWTAVSIPSTTLQSTTSFCSNGPDQSMKQIAIFWWAPDLIPFP
jgi:hypothetical protein